MNTELQQHPLSAAFPAMNEEDFQALKDSIDANGVLNPITLFEGMVIDGWHRYRAACELEMECPSVEFPAQWVDPRDFVRAQNKERRHLTKGAWALIEVELNEWVPANIGRPRGALSAPLEKARTANEKMAANAGTGVRSIQQAKTVKTMAVPEVAAAVKAGEVGLVKAAEVAKLPKEQQAEALKKPLPKPDPEPEYFGPSDEEIAEAESAAMAEAEALQAQLAADGELAKLAEINKRQAAEIASLKATRDGYMNQCAEQVRKIKSLQRRLDKLEKARAV